MASQDPSSSERGYRYLQHLTLDDTTDSRSYNMSGFTSRDEGGSGSNTSYVLVERDDAGTSSEWFSATEESHDAGWHEVQDGLDLEQDWLRHQSHQNSLGANQFGYPQSTTSDYNPQSDAGPPNAADGQYAHQTQRFVQDDISGLLPAPTMYAWYSNNYLHPPFHAPTTINDQELVFPQTQVDTPGLTQPLYILVPINLQPHDTNSQGGNTMSAYLEPTTEALDGLQPTECQYPDRQIYLEQRVNGYVNVINTPDIGHASGRSGRASALGSMPPDTMVGQESGGASAATLRLDAAEQSNPVVYPYGSRYPVHLGDKGNFPMDPSGAVSQPALPTPRAKRTRPRTTSSRHNSRRNNSHRNSSHRTAPVPIMSTSSNSVQEDVIQCSDCLASFGGAWGGGNYGRHKRAKHGVQVKTYPCSICGNVYLRSDARLKHRRLCH